MQGIRWMNLIWFGNVSCDLHSEMAISHSIVVVLGKKIVRKGSAIIFWLCFHLFLSLQDT